VIFIDDVRIEPSEVRAEGSLYVDPAADYLKDHFPGTPMLPGLLMLEASVRTAAALWRVQPGCGQAEGAVLARVDRLQVVRRVVPCETLVVRVEMSGDRERGRAAFIAQGHVGEQMAMRARFELVLRETENRFPGEDTTQA
jgi:3-hydroxyacyl-[acyl-carrier-protein] dehydratase